MARRIISTNRPDTLTQTFFIRNVSLASGGGPYIAAKARGGPILSEMATFEERRDAPLERNKASRITV
jgi:hypothetical protein